VKTKTKVLIGIIAFVSVVSIASVLSVSILNAEPVPAESGPDDPGNSPGPGNWMGEEISLGGQLILKPTSPISSQCSFCQ